MSLTGERSKNYQPKDKNAGDDNFNETSFNKQNNGGSVMRTFFLVIVQLAHVQGTCMLLWYR
jgi:hypothetical protein